MADQASEHPLVGERVIALSNPLAVFFFGAAFMMANVTTLFWLGLCLAFIGVAGTFWIYSKELKKIFQEPATIVDAPHGVQVAVGSFSIEVLVLLFLTWQFWPSSAPLVIFPEVGRGNYPENQPIAGIKWHPDMFAELKVTLANPSEGDYSDLDVTINIDLPMWQL